MPSNFFKFLGPEKRLSRKNLHRHSQHYHLCKQINIKPEKGLEFSKARENFICTNLYESFGRDVPNTSNLIPVFFAKS